MEQHDSETSRAQDPEARAALTLIESLLLSLSDRGLIDGGDLDEIFDAAIDAHRNQEQETPISRAAAAILERLRTQGNSVRLRR